MKLPPMRYDTKRELEAGILEYLMFCDRNRTVARVGELALSLQINRHALSLMCRRLFGLPTKAVLASCQLAKAARLLRETSLPIDEVAAQAGFGDRRSFHFTEELFAISKADPSWETQVHEPLLRLEQSARNNFPPDLLFAAFGQLGPGDLESTAAAISPSEPHNIGRGLTPIPQQVSECTCSEASDWCYWGSSCSGAICYRSEDDSGCGFGWQYECSGKCHRN